MKDIRSILVATDLSGNSDTVVRAGAALAALTGAELHLLHAFEFEPQAYAPQEEQEADTFQSRVADAERNLNEQIKRAVPDVASVASHGVVVFAAFKAIRDRARAVNADLVVLGRHRPRQGFAGFLGGTADRVIRTSDVPCLIVHRPLSLPLRTVVVPIDLSSPAFGALEVAVRWSGSLSAAKQPPDLIMLHVIPQVFNFADVPIDAARLTLEMHSQVEDARAEAPADGLGNVREEIRWADSPADEIQSVARDEKADLIVMGTHGHGAFKRALIGSVAASVARGADCPVLLVPPAMWQADESSNAAL